MNTDLKLGLDVKPEVLAGQLDRMRANGNYYIQIAVHDHHTVGFVAAYKALILEIPNEYLRIIGLAVKTEYRHKGVGKQLINEAVQYARQNDLAYIAFNSTIKAEEDHMIYEALGFEKKSFGFSRKVRC